MSLSLIIGTPLIFREASANFGGSLQETFRWEVHLHALLAYFLGKQEVTDAMFFPERMIF